MLCNPTHTCLWVGRLTPAIRAMTRSPNLRVGAPQGVPDRNGSKVTCEFYQCPGLLGSPRPCDPEPGMGSVPMLRRRTPLAPVSRDRPRYSSAAPQGLTRARDVARAAHFWKVRPVGPTCRRNGSAGLGNLADQPRGRPRVPPLRLAFLSRLSYWCDIRWAWTCAMKSMTTTTTISSEVPPK